jgi:hypothetical protein
MAKKQFFLILDTETAIDDRVADFGAIIVDRAGNIHAQCAVMVNGVFGAVDLFYDTSKTGLWARSGLNKRTDRYNAMLENGTRTLASVNAINRWLEKAAGKYNPTLTAYNLAFDAGKCFNTGIDLSMFSDRFCLWGAAVGMVCNTKKYREFVLQNHLFNTPTEQRNMTFSTTAESVAGYLAGEFRIEPHTALEDAIDFELPILKHIVAKKDWKNKITPYNWRNHQVKDYFKA